MCEQRGEPTPRLRGVDILRPCRERRRQRIKERVGMRERGRPETEKYNNNNNIKRTREKNNNNIILLKNILYYIIYTLASQIHFLCTYLL